MKKEQVMKTLRAYSMVIVLVVIAVLFHLLTNGLIFTAMNLTNIILQNSYVVLLILGMLPVILTGNVDLSVGSVLAFVGAIPAILQVNYHCGVLVTLLVSLLVGILIGCWQGMWIAYFDIPAFLVTLSGELVFRGLTQVVLDGASIGPFSDTFRAIASSFIPDLFGGSGAIGIEALSRGADFAAFAENNRKRLPSDDDDPGCAGLRGVCLPAAARPCGQTAPRRAGPPHYRLYHQVCRDVRRHPLPLLADGQL